MKWNFQIVKAQHYREIGNIPGVEHGGDYGLFKDFVTKQLCYYDKESDTLVPMLDDPLSPKDIIVMEEWTQEDEGFIFMDCETRKFGLIVKRRQ
jgi:hypothetical protein